MSAPASTPRQSPRQSPGHLRGLFASVARYLKARLSLLLMEARDAGIQYGVGVALGAGGVFVAVLGYVFVVITAVFAIAAWWSWRHAWIVVMGVAALLHLAGAVALMLLALRKFRTAAFEGTIGELKEDQKWMNQPNGKN